MKCPCHSQLPYAQCCEPYHKGELPLTPLDLMRSRYCAYALGLVDYVAATDVKAVDLKEIEHFCKATDFIGLEILETSEDTVTFRAILKQQGKDVSFTEKSRFEKKNGKWLYSGITYLA